MDAITLADSPLQTSLRVVSEPFARLLGLPKLPEHADTIVLAFTFFLLVHVVLAPAISREWLKGAGKRHKNNCYIHIVSTAHVLLIIPLAWRCLDLQALEKDRAFGWDARVGVAHGVAAGYFLWDTLDSLFNYTDIGYVIHGAACLSIYTLGFKPFVPYYGVRHLFWETSTLFLNIHWFLDKSGRTGSTLQLINGFALLGTFFGVRIVWGGKMSYEFFHTMSEVRNEIPTLFVWVYGGGNLLLQGLNWFWFLKMIDALRRRFRDTERQRIPGDHHANGEGVSKS